MNVSKSERLVSLDVFRGIAIAGMVLVNNPGTWSHIYPALRHAEWNGCTPTDLIFPFFLFIVGVAITFALTKRKQQGTGQKQIIGKIIQRSLILFGLGLILNGFPYFDLSSIRIPGVLQRIAVVYLISSIIFLKTNVRTQAILAVAFLLIYWGLMTLVLVPGVGEPNLEPTTNLAAWLDNLLLGDHLWSQTEVWDPEGILSTIPAVATGLSGVLTGHLLKSSLSPERKTVWMFFAGAVAIVLGYAWDMWFPLNKSIWTSSYVLYTGGLALQFLAFCYWLIDVQKVQWWAKPFRVYGLNPITLFFGSTLVAKLLYTIKVTGENSEAVALKAYLFQNLLSGWMGPINASLIWALLYVIIWLGLMWILYAKNIFIKV